MFPTNNHTLIGLSSGCPYMIRHIAEYNTEEFHFLFTLDFQYWILGISFYKKEYSMETEYSSIELHFFCLSLSVSWQGS